MRKLLAMSGTMLLLLAGGCGLKSYEFRLEKTLEDMKYLDRLNRMLMPAASKGKWEELQIYLRPPKKLEQAKEWQLQQPEPGKFDLEASFLEAQKQSLQVLARVKRPKNAAKKKAAPSPADTADRTNFPRDVIGILNESYKPAEELTVDKFKPTREKQNDFKWHTFSVNDKNIQAYLYKQDPYEVALIFEFPKVELPNLVTKIKLCLESFAVGAKARRSFAGTSGEEESGEGTGGAGGSGVAF